MTYGELLERLYELDPLELNQLVSVHVIDTDDVYLAKDICVATLKIGLVRSTRLTRLVELQISVISLYWMFSKS
mgnify:CR=1 FL=1